MENVNIQKNNNEKTPRTTKELVIFILKIVGNVVFYGVMLTLILFSIMNANAGGKGTDFPHIFGRGFLAVKSDSMDGKATGENLGRYEIGSFKKDDLVNVKVYKDKDFDSLKVGDVITFYDTDIKYLNTHRIVYINKENRYIIAQGDKELMYSDRIYDTSNPSSYHNFQLEEKGYIQNVPSANIKGVVTSVKAGAGKTLTNIQTYWPFYFMIPVGIILVFEILMVVKNLLDLKNAKNREDIKKDKEAMMADLEAQKEAMRQQILAELAAEHASTKDNDSAESTTSNGENEAPEEVEQVDNETNVEETTTDNNTNVEETTIDNETKDADDSNLEK